MKLSNINRTLWGGILSLIIGITGEIYAISEDGNLVICMLYGFFIINGIYAVYLGVKEK